MCFASPRAVALPHLVRVGVRVRVRVRVTVRVRIRVRVRFKVGDALPHISPRREHSAREKCGLPSATSCTWLGLGLG